MLTRDKIYKNILVVGAGPIGDALVLKLRELGLNPIQVEKRKLRTRPGHLNGNIFDIVSEHIKRQIKPTSAYHIKDVERGLEKIIEEEKVDRIEGQYVKLIKNGAEVMLPSGKVEFILCDLIIDATGSKRKVLSTVNEIYKEKQEEPPFQFSDIGKNPSRKHFIAYVGMEKEYADELKRMQVGVSDTLNYMDSKSDMLKRQLIEISRLRQEFGWEHFGRPQITVTPLEKNKVCMYIEMPEKLKADNHEHWVKAVLKLVTNKDIPFTHLKVSNKYKLNPKPRFNTIDMQPKETTPFYFDSEDYPTVIPVGDALIDPDYRLGAGIPEGLKRINALLESIEVQDGIVTKIDFTKYTSIVEPSIAEQKGTLISLYHSRAQNLEVSYHFLIQIYLEIKSNPGKHIVFEEIVKDLSLPGREWLIIEFANKLYEKADLTFRYNILNNETDGIDVKKTRWQEALDMCCTHLSEALTLLPPNEDENRKKILLLMEKVALKTKDLADKFVNGEDPIPLSGKELQQYDALVSRMQLTVKMNRKRYTRTGW